jgi:hypothetical protein
MRAKSKPFTRTRNTYRSLDNQSIRKRRRVRLQVDQILMNERYDTPKRKGSESRFLVYYGGKGVKNGGVDGFDPVEDILAVGFGDWVGGGAGVGGPFLEG